MDQHPIPRQITTFEFKLIGFMTLKQFLYLAVSFPLAYVIFQIFPIPFLNFILAFLVGGAGVVAAFVPIYDRSLDVWVKNVWKRLQQPTQYYYKKKNDPLYFLKDLYFLADPHHMLAHIESRDKLAQYLAMTRQKPKPNYRKKQIGALLQASTDSLASGNVHVPPPPAVPAVPVQQPAAAMSTTLAVSSPPSAVSPSNSSRAAAAAAPVAGQSARPVNPFAGLAQANIRSAEAVASPRSVAMPADSSQMPGVAVKAPSPVFSSPAASAAPASLSSQKPTTPPPRPTIPPISPPVMQVEIAEEAPAREKMPAAGFSSAAAANPAPPNPMPPSPAPPNPMPAAAHLSGIPTPTVILPNGSMTHPELEAAPTHMSPPPVPTVLVTPPAPAPSAPPKPPPAPVISPPAHPFFMGVIKNSKKIPLPGIIVYVKDGSGKPQRILKTNPHGLFVTFNPMPPGEYEFEIKDPNGTYFFDTIKVPVASQNPRPFEFHSRELL